MRVRAYTYVHMYLHIAHCTLHIYIHVHTYVAYIRMPRHFMFISPATARTEMTTTQRLSVVIWGGNSRMLREMAPVAPRPRSRMRVLLVTEH